MPAENERPLLRPQSVSLRVLADRCTDLLHIRLDQAVRMRCPQLIHFSVLICYKEAVLVCLLIFLQFNGCPVISETAVDPDDQVIIFHIAENICPGFDLHLISDLILRFFR